MDADADSSPMHIVVFPWLAFGHVLPCLELAERLAARGHHVSFVSTPRIIARLRPVAPALAPLVDFVALPLPRVDGLPDGAEATSDIPRDKYELHHKAFDGLAAPFSAFLDTACAEGGKNRPDWVVVDNFHYWAAAAALDHKVPCVLNLPYSATSLAHYGVLPEESTLEDHAPGTSIARRFALTLERCKLVAQRSCIEFEPESITRLPEIFGKPVIPLGLLPPPPVRGGHGPGTDTATAGQHDDTTMSWLDKQPPKSVVYVCFGSELPLTVEQLHELALGLELAGTRFLWALRKPHGVHDADILPPGFEERTHGRGLVAMGWVPQVKILAHNAVGAFMMHCGWSSVIEGLQFGHPLIMLPFLLDHWPTARNLEGVRKVGVQVPRGEKDGSFDRDGVAGAVRAVVVEEEGRRVLAANAKKLQEVVADRECHERCIDGFIEHLRSYKE